MSASSEKPAHVQVAEAGFGEVVQRHGFRRVAKAHWRLDGDGIVHHLMLRPGPKSNPGSFRDFDAVFFPEFEALCETCGIDNDSSKLPLGKARYHFGGYHLIAGQDYWRQREAYEAENPPRELSTWEFLVDLFKRSPPEPRFDRDIYRPPYGWWWSDRYGAFPEEGAWTIPPGRLDEVAASVTNTW